MGLSFIIQGLKAEVRIERESRWCIEKSEQETGIQPGCRWNSLYRHSLVGLDQPWTRWLSAVKLLARLSKM